MSALVRTYGIPVTAMLLTLVILARIGFFGGESDEQRRRRILREIDESY